MLGIAPVGAGERARETFLRKLGREWERARQWIPLDGEE